MGSLLLGTQLELHNTLHLTISLMKSKLFPKKKLQLGIENAELPLLGYCLIFHTFENSQAKIFSLQKGSYFFNFAIIPTKSFQKRSAHERVKKKVGQPSCFTIANTSD